MRTIKFRAWSKPMKKMLEVREIEFSGEEIGVAYSPEQDRFWIKFESAELLQFTGYRDKDGGEIYEKDLVEWQGKIWVIHFGDGSARYCLFDPTEGAYDITHGERENYKIIGNIYEHLNLLT